MVTSINHQELLDLRNKIIDIVIDNLNSWDKDIETGIKIIEDNFFTKLLTLNPKRCIIYSVKSIFKLRLIFFKQIISILIFNSRSICQKHVAKNQV